MKIIKETFDFPKIKVNSEKYTIFFDNDTSVCWPRCCYIIRNKLLGPQIDHTIPNYWNKCQIWWPYMNRDLFNLKDTLEFIEILKIAAKISDDLDKNHCNNPDYSKKDINDYLK